MISLVMPGVLESSLTQLPANWAARLGVAAVVGAVLRLGETEADADADAEADADECATGAVGEVAAVGVELRPRVRLANIQSGTATASRAIPPRAIGTMPDGSSAVCRMAPTRAMGG